MYILIDKLVTLYCYFKNNIFINHASNAIPIISLIINQHNTLLECDMHMLYILLFDIISLKQSYVS